MVQKVNTDLSPIIQSPCSPVVTTTTTTYGYPFKICNTGAIRLFDGWTNNFSHFAYGSSYKSTPFNAVDFFLNNPT
jgi:hypothetical protein